MFKAIPFIKKEIMSASWRMSEVCPTGVDLIHARDIWNYANYGDNVVIAVIDSGVNYNHPDLRMNMLPGRNFVRYGDEYDPYDYMDYNGHGTHVAGTIAARINKWGVVGVAPKAKILPIRVLDEYGSGSQDWVREGIEYATKWRGIDGEKVRVISMSLGSGYNDEKLHEAIKEAVNVGIVVVCAAGNEGDNDENTSEYSFPSSYNEVISVGACDLSGTKVSDFSNTNDEVDLVAPGEDIYSTSSDGRFVCLSGTSMACPHVSASVALLINKLEREYGREMLECEIYANLIKATRLLNDYGRNAQGNGLLDLRIACECATE